ncbi:hypothetical protein Salat_0517000 [Sesamum alatum]|uniref:Uncharacterized protein n=1 Tax=Sesamum alatum TaxID=300844 RepID=A0AAE1Z4L8_9LAMI|nr:hypothetical protein Salat_0517000 [Sesamum alatum]
MTQQATWTNSDTPQSPPQQPNVIIINLQTQDNTCTSSSLLLQLPNSSFLPSISTDTPVKIGFASQSQQQPPCITTTSSLISESLILSHPQRRIQSRIPLAFRPTFAFKSTTTAQSPSPFRICTNPTNNKHRNQMIPLGSNEFLFQPFHSTPHLFLSPCTPQKTIIELSQER